jgi:hypothetical protein
MFDVAHLELELNEFSQRHCCFYFYFDFVRCETRTPTTIATTPLL